MLGPLLAAWLGSTAISLGSLLWTRQALRWEAFVFPALAILGGTALAGLHRQGRLGRSVAYALAGAVVCAWRGPVVLADRNLSALKKPETCEQTIAHRSL